jgi:hypothetical protein
MSTIFRNLFTGVDNSTYDLGRVIWVHFALVYSLVSVWHLYNGNGFDPLTWSAGAGAVMASGSGSLLLKKSTEPTP